MHYKIINTPINLLPGKDKPYAETYRSLHELGQAGKFFETIEVFLGTKFRAFDEVKTNHDRRLEAFSTKLASLEQTIHTIDIQSLPIQISTLSAKFEALDTEPQPDYNYNLRVRLAGVETDVENLIDTLPSARRASEVVTELLENANALKTIVGYQSQQFNQAFPQSQRFNHQLFSMTLVPKHLGLEP